MERDRSDVVAEVAAAFEAYERALAEHDVDTIMSFFADRAVRFGVADRQDGVDEQRRWRVAQGPLPPGRFLKETQLHTYGDSTAVVTTLFGYPGPGVLGRQTQAWARLPEGWRIITAHVSEPAGADPG